MFVTITIDKIKQLVLSGLVIKYQKIYIKLECGPVPNVTAAQPNIGGALCESSVTPFLVSRHKVWLTPAAGVLCSNATNIRESETWA